MRRTGRGMLVSHLGLSREGESKMAELEGEAKALGENRGFFPTSWQCPSLMLLAFPNLSDILSASDVSHSVPRQCVCFCSIILTGSSTQYLSYLCS